MLEKLELFKAMYYGIYNLFDSKMKDKLLKTN